VLNFSQPFKEADMANPTDAAPASRFDRYADNVAKTNDAHGKYVGLGNDALAATATVTKVIAVVTEPLSRDESPNVQNGMTYGPMAGAAVGAMVGGPVGAVVGGLIGLGVGTAAGGVADAVQGHPCPRHPNGCPGK
jgi:hypothetical protein